MAKGEAKRINKSLTDEGDRINRESDTFGNTLYGRLPGAQQRNQQSWDSAMKGFQGILDDPGFGFGNYNPNFSGYEDLFKNFAQTGGLSPENISRIRGNGGFDEFAKTGGYSPEDISNIRARNSAQIPAFYSALKNRLDQMNKISGGSPSYGASESRMARDQFRQGAQANLEGEIGLKRDINEGRRWGIGGMSGAELGLGELQSKNKLAGLEGALRAAGMGADQAARYADITGRNRLGAAEGIRGMRTDVPGEEFGLYDFLMKNQGQRGQLAGGNLQNRMAYNPNRSFLDQLGQLTGGVAPALLSAFGGPAGLLGKGKGAGMGGNYSRGDFSSFLGGNQLTNPFKSGGNPFFGGLPQGTNFFNYRSPYQGIFG